MTAGKSADDVKYKLDIIILTWLAIDVGCKIFRVHLHHDAEMCALVNNNTQVAGYVGAC